VGCTSVIFMKLPKAKNNTLGENSPNLITPLLFQNQFQRAEYPFRSCVVIYLHLQTLFFCCRILIVFITSRMVLSNWTQATSFIHVDVKSAKLGIPTFKNLMSEYNPIAVRSSFQFCRIGPSTGSAHLTTPWEYTSGSKLKNQI
jgi:hypothetical protein